MAETYDDRVNLSESSTRFIKRRVSEVAPTLDSDDNAPFTKRIKFKPAVLTSVVAGGVAGVIVDVALYPLDTIKTRLQSKGGLRASGGFKGIYKGVIPVVLCSAPLSAIFFATYNTLVNTLKTENSTLNPVVYVVSASAAEVVGSVLRVPLEIVKQRKQTSSNKSLYIIRQTLRREGVPGLYRGLLSTLSREIPFAAIQYPVWEMAINEYVLYQNGKELNALQIAVCGAIAGAVAAAVTTPMDVIKTRVMLEDKDRIDKLGRNINLYIAKEVYLHKGIKGFWAGVLPRVLWITLGGFIYFGAYEKTKSLFEERCRRYAARLKSVHDVAPSYLEEKFEKFFFSKEGRCEVEYADKKTEKEEEKAEEEKELDDEEMEQNEVEEDEITSVNF